MKNLVVGGGFNTGVNEDLVLDLSNNAAETSIVENNNDLFLDLSNNAAETSIVENNNDSVLDLSNNTPVVEETPTPETIIIENNNTAPQEHFNQNPLILEDQHILNIDDTSALKYLNEKLGKNFQSLEDLDVKQNTINPLDKDPYLKEIYEWRERTGRPIEDWAKFQKDYNSIQDIDVVREFLQYEYPTLTKEDIDLELKKFTVTEDDLDDDISYKKLELKKQALKARASLNNLVTNFNSPLSSHNYPKEIQQDLEIAKQVKFQHEQGEKLRQDYTINIKEISNKVDSFKINLPNNLSLDYKLTDQSKKELPTMIDTMPHWKNQDGSWNHKAVVEDAIKIKHFNDMINLAYEQGLNAGKESIISQTKNVNMKQPTPYSANTNNSQSGFRIEALDKFLGRNTLKIL